MIAVLVLVPVPLNVSYKSGIFMVMHAWLRDCSCMLAPSASEVKAFIKNSLLWISWPLTSAQDRGNCACYINHMIFIKASSKLYIGVKV